MQPTISSQLKNFEEYLILRNFSMATRSMYLRRLESFLRFAQRKHSDRPLSQELARSYILQRHKQGKSWSTINCDYSSLRKYFKEVLEYEWLFWSQSISSSPTPYRLIFRNPDTTAFMPLKHSKRSKMIFLIPSRGTTTP